MTSVRPGRAALAAVILAVLVQVSGALAQPAPIVIKEVVVEGNRRVQEAVILGRVRSVAGGIFNPSLVAEDLRAVFGLGFFDDVQTRVEDFEGGVRLTFVVVERPFVRDVAFAGNERTSAAELQEKIDLKLGSVYNPADVERARQRLLEHYEEEGYFEATVTPGVEAFPDGDVRVVLAIVEGRRITIDKIVIEGNQGLSARLIKAALVTQERTWLILRGVIQRQQLDEDVNRILDLYNDHGFRQARVEKQDLAVDRQRARVTYTIRVVEGPQYKVGTLSFRGVTLFPEEEMRRQLLLRTDTVFSRGRLRDSLRRIHNLYSAIGRASAEVTPRTEEEGERVHVVFEVAEGPEVYVERINITGNVRSQDKVLRRELPLAEGELFTLQKLERSRQRLVNLQFFETVNITTRPGADKTRIIVDVDVAERPTGLFSLGGGFSSIDGLVGTIDLSQNNFLGRGWQATLRIRAGGRSQQGVISFTEPWLFDRPLAAGFDLFSTQRQFDEYDYETVGGQLRLSRPFAEFWRWHLGYRLARDRISDVVEGQEALLAGETGSRVTSLVTASIVRDNRDNVTAPTRGGQFTVGVDLAGLGGDSRYLKTVASSTYFQPIWFGHILSGRVEAGYGTGLGGEELPVYERFYLGGPNSLRGVKYRRISPRDETGVRIGGTSELLGNLEYIVPLPFNFRAAGFFDIGNAYGFGTKFDPTDTREAAGGGLRWLSPFGPIRVDYGINLDRRKGEDFGAFHFSVGSPF